MFSDWSTLKHSVPQGSILGHLLSIIHINNLPMRLNSISKPIIFAYDTSEIISSRNFEELYSVPFLVVSHMIKWSAANKLVLNLDKINTIKFTANNSSHTPLYTGYKEKYSEETVNTKFLGLQIDNHLSWKNNAKQIRGACYTIKLMAHISNINTLKSIYYAHFHSIIEYGIIFWDNSSISWKIFTLQKKFFRIMAGAQPRTTHRSLLKQLEILPFPCQYLFSLLNFIINIQEIFQTNLSVHNIKTRNKHHLHRQNAKLSCFQKRTFYAGIKILRFTM